MLIAFSVGNYRSIKETQTLSMLAANLVSKNKETDINNVISVNDKLSLVATTAIYGANASGKSNFVGAVRFMRNFVLNSSKDSQSEERIRTDVFKLSTETEDKPSFFQMIFLIDGIQYRYGFEVNSVEVVSEWLYYTPRSREARLFDRDYQNIHVTDNFKEGKGVEPRTRENALFISVVSQFNGSLAKRILAWFRNITVNLGVDDSSEQANAILRFSNLKNKDRVLSFVKALDLGISDIVAVQEPFTLPKIGDMPEAFVNFFNSLEGTEVPRIKTSHNKYDEKGDIAGSVVFDFQEHESHGTQRLFNLIVPILDTLRRGEVLFVDELDARMHPLLTCALIKLFNSKDTNKKNAQLVFTTHDTNLLNNNLFRRDQIWFAEKDKYSATHLYSLVEFKVRNDASFDRDYIKGKYGAIPFLGDISPIIENSYE